MSGFGWVWVGIKWVGPLKPNSPFKPFNKVEITLATHFTKLQQLSPSFSMNLSCLSRWISSSPPTQITDEVESRAQIANEARCGEARRGAEWRPTQCFFSSSDPWALSLSLSSRLCRGFTRRLFCVNILWIFCVICCGFSCGLLMGGLWVCDFLCLPWVVGGYRWLFYYCGFCRGLCG